jgi:hypothetical protein
MPQWPFLRLDSIRRPRLGGEGDDAAFAGRGAGWACLREAEAASLRRRQGSASAKPGWERVRSAAGWTFINLRCHAAETGAPGMGRSAIAPLAHPAGHLNKEIVSW